MRWSVEDNLSRHVITLFYVVQNNVLLWGWLSRRCVCVGGWAGDTAYLPLKNSVATLLPVFIYFYSDVYWPSVTLRSPRAIPYYPTFNVSICRRIAFHSFVTVDSNLFHSLNFYAFSPESISNLKSFFSSRGGRIPCHIINQLHASDPRR